MTEPKKIAHQLTEHTKLLQKAVLVSNNKVLLLKRSEEASSRPGCWDVPGGNSEWPELQESKGGLYKEDLIREVREETGIALDESVFDPNALIYFDTYFEVDRQVYSIIANWWVELPDNFSESKVELSAEHTEYTWVTKDELETYDFGGEKGTFVLESIKTALEYSSALATADHSHEPEAHGCCGGNCGCRHQ